MKKYKIIIEYDGTKYKGWQRLADTDKTIQQKIEALLSRLLEEPIEIHGAGRTDAGVHAYGQVAHFESSEKLELNKFIIACNEMLPQDIVIKEAEEVSEDFHARFSAKSKHYVYKIWNDPIPSALLRRYTYHLPKKLNLDKMRQAAVLLLGEHDFQSFSAIKAKNKSTTRKLFSIEIKQADELVEIHYHGEGFLYKMVRLLTGTLIEVGLGEKQPEDIPLIFAKKNKKYAGAAAPSHGLYLFKVKY